LGAGADELERLEAKEAHPLASEIVSALGFNRRVLYVALLLLDIGKGERRDHSEVGAEIAGQVCPRLGLSEAETETVVWLVRHHLLMSDVAQKRDITDARTIRDFADEVRSPERLRLLTVLTVCDIRGVGPGVWNNWKAQLIRDLYHEARQLLSGASDGESRRIRVQRARVALAEALAGWPEAELSAELERHYLHYWLGLDTLTQAVFAQMAREQGG
jgi:UTP:GlnB (protein PII) uridylyltransferase